MAVLLLSKTDSLNRHASLPAAAADGDAGLSMPPPPPPHRKLRAVLKREALDRALLPLGVLGVSAAAIGMMPHLSCASRLEALNLRARPRAARAWAEDVKQGGRVRSGVDWGGV